MLTLCAVLQDDYMCIRAEGPTSAVWITSISYRLAIVRLRMVLIVVVPGEMDVQSPTTLNDKCFRIR